MDLTQDQTKGTQCTVHIQFGGRGWEVGDESGAEKEALTEWHTKTVFLLFWDSVQIDIAFESTFNKRENSQVYTLSLPCSHSAIHKKRVHRSSGHLMRACVCSTHA